MKSERQNDIERFFTYHPPTQEQIRKYGVIRDKAKELAMVIDKECPENHDSQVALDKLREAVMWANASIACHKEP